MVACNFGMYDLPTFNEVNHSVKEMFIAIQNILVLHVYEQVAFINSSDIARSRQDIPKQTPRPLRSGASRPRPKG